MKINKNLIVEIPIRFKDGLKKKWDKKPKKPVELTGTDNCPLCREFYRGLSMPCNGCPFDPPIRGKIGCANWIEKLRGNRGVWGVFYFTPAQLKSFLVKARAHIRWIKEKS